MTETMQKTSSLVVEYHYSDGDVGAHPAGKAETYLWKHFSKSKEHGPSHIVIRPDSKTGQDHSNKLLAGAQAMAVCYLLAEAYTRGAVRGGSVDLEDIDMAYTKAKEVILSVDPKFKFREQINGYHVEYKANEKFVIEVNYGDYETDHFQYPTDQARLTGLARLLGKAISIKDGIARSYYFGHTDENTVLRDSKIVAKFDGESVTFCEYGLPQLAPATT